MADRIQVVDYDPSWPKGYAEERRRLRAALGAKLGAMEHIGSTAVPGLAAKPTLDLMLGVEEIATWPELVGPMTRVGYKYLGEFGIPGRHFFRKGLPPTHHIHWVRRDGDFWTKQLVFRDYLREHPRQAAEYGRTKRMLAQKHAKDRAAYTASKTGFILDLQELAWRWAGADLIVIDLEATCWSGGQHPGSQEIIEIGAVRLDSKLKPAGEFRTFIKPREKPILSPFCTELTSIRQSDVDAAPSFVEALRAFRRWIGKGPYRIASWSDYDLHQLQRDCVRYGSVLPAPLEVHLDLRALHARLRQGKPIPMVEAMTREGLSYTGRLHTGIDDARNAARMAQLLLGAKA